MKDGSLYEKTKDLLESERERRIFASASAVLKDIGITSDMSGYYYIIESVTILINEKALKIRASDIYKIVGRKYGKNPSDVDRAIRYAVGRARLIKKQSFHYQLLLLDLSNSSNIRFLRDLADYLSNTEEFIINTDYFTKSVSGYIYMTLKEQGYSSCKIIKLIQIAERKMKEISYEDAYKEYKNELMPKISISDAPS